MDKKKFLEQQLEWSKKQAYLLDEINIKLHEMKAIAQYALNEELATEEVEELNSQLNDLKGEVHALEKQLHSVVH